LKSWTDFDKSIAQIEFQAALPDRLMRNTHLDAAPGPFTPESDSRVDVVAGRRNKQIAFEIGTSEVTVKVHRTNLMRKMQASSLADLIMMTAKLRIPEGSTAILSRTGNL
jgi:DNA-binding NarL/FixJ family response regulator